MIKLTGAGALVEFASAVDAVECAGAVQKGIAERAAGMYEVPVSSPLPRLQPASVRSAVGENGELSEWSGSSGGRR